MLDIASVGASDGWFEAVFAILATNDTREVEMRIEC